MSDVNLPHITVCICTYRRGDLLKRLLIELGRQDTGGRFTCSAVVADNDAGESARTVVDSFVAASRFPVVYCVEPQRNIALARNRAVAHATGDYIAFIDDDEYPTADWLLKLYEVCTRLGVSGVLAPVVAEYESEPPRWVKAGGFYDRPRHTTGFELGWAECRTGNVLFRRRILGDLAVPFREEFGSGGEDQDFFRRLSEKGHRFAWCDEAVAHEFVPASRWDWKFLMSRAVLRGRNSVRHRRGLWRNVLKSVIAVPLYAAALPLCWLVGRQYFMKYLIKLGDHAGRLLAIVGLNRMTERPM